MKSIGICILFLIVLSVSASGQDSGIRNDVNILIDSLNTLEGNVFAPKTFEKTMKQYQDAVETAEKQKHPDKIREEWEETRVLALNTIEVIQKAYLNFENQIKIRRNAVIAESPRLAPDLYEEAEKKLVEASKKLESDDVKSSVEKAGEAGPLYDQAELTAIKRTLLDNARTLIAKSVEEGAESFAPQSLAKARTAIASADTLLTENRYERNESLKLIATSEYQARHASEITETITAMERTDADWEKIILKYEDEMNRIAEAVGLPKLKFDEGPAKAADSLVAVTSEIGAKISEALANLDAGETAENPAVMAVILEKRVAEILKEKNNLAAKVANRDEELSQLQATHDEVAEDLRERKEREAKFKKAQSIIGTDEGEVLFNASNDIVIRLPGLSFDIGKSEIKEDHIPLLRKIEEILMMFPDARYFIEGHTDDRGDPAGNQRLSEERAQAVANWLRESLIIGPDRISAIGFGSDKPVAPNNTPEGRARNRRIDIVIMK